MAHETGQEHDIKMIDATPRFAAWATGLCDAMSKITGIPPVTFVSTRPMTETDEGTDPLNAMFQSAPTRPPMMARAHC